MMQNDEELGLYNEWDNTLMDGLKEIKVEEVINKVRNYYNTSCDIDGRPPSKIELNEFLDLLKKNLYLCFMGKITIEFDSVEESQDARVALDAMKWKMAMWDLDQKLRSTTKHGIKFYSNEEASSEEIDICQKMRDEIRETLDGYGLNLND